jgi:hypothetical protein
MSGDSVTKGGAFDPGDGIAIREATMREDAAREEHLQLKAGAVGPSMPAEEVARRLGIPVVTGTPRWPL